ncbi:MAG TPA: hypothetical protein DFJ59_05165 [Alphaproteobacteria bacterium]|nr:hypothetical protein [Alphaproteobacteria bacterium]
MAPGLIPPSLITASALVGAMFLLSGRDATGLAPGPTFDELPASGTLTREAPVMVFKLDGPTFLAVYDPLVISDDGVLWHAHKNCPGTPENYAFPASQPLQIRDDLRRVTMACQYGLK